MSIAEEFMDLFLAAHPQVRTGNLNMNEIDSLIAEHENTLNGLPLKDFDGLNTAQLNDLMNDTLSNNSLLKFRQDIAEHVDKVPLFILSELLLNAIQEPGSIKLTQTGGLPAHICELLYSQKLIIIPYENITHFDEDEISCVWSLKQYLLKSGMAKKRHNVITLTKKGEKAMKGPKTDRFLSLFNYMSNSFHWSNFYDRDEKGRFGRFGWAYSVVLLSIYGGVARDSRFYSNKLIHALDNTSFQIYKQIRDKRHLEHDQATYNICFFDFFATWFGLVNIEHKELSIFHRSELSITKTPLLDQLFEITPW